MQRVVTGLFFPLTPTKYPASFGVHRVPADMWGSCFSSEPHGGGRVGSVSIFPGTTEYTTVGQWPNGGNQITEGRPQRSYPSFLSSPQPRGLLGAQGLLLSLLGVPGSRQQTSSTDSSYVFQAAPSHPGTVN